ncbi:MAG: hypothetical protein LBB74_01110 [Chitinispirillales bacterium]|jgi:M6 family metalloprotease-like protein|nr:hypothetical protein [Chitinispirillales bacterium]
MIKMIYCLLILLIIFAPVPVAAQVSPSVFKPRDLLLKSSSRKNILETARNHQWSIDFVKSGVDTVKIIAIRVEFEPDTSSLTTGDGRFGMRGDVKELRFYNADTVYKYDGLPHGALYFERQLTALANYYAKASRGMLALEFSLYPAGGGDAGYKVGSQMTGYSPGWKRKQESIDAYWDRKTRGLMTFVRDAVKEAAKDVGNSPFRGLYRDGDILRERATGRKAVILILHAGASYMTDGGTTGEADSPSDMIDAFINRDYFKYYRDAIAPDSVGITVTGADGEALTVDEVMMCAETSNQDGLNWGVQGILVNQMARQLGIPDLFSTSSGVSAIGAFCIMDFAGYSAGQGFIPPYPSAWVRAFMGWDRPYTVGAGGGYGVKALTSAIDREGAGRMFGNDTSILLIPINGSEYYLVENRQRNLSGDRSVFKYDNGAIISAYPFNVNIDANVKRFSDGASRVILETKNNDISLPASGVLVWHIDERVIRQKLEHNIVNADSSYRGVRLVEADGINDLGVTFKDAFYQAAFDYGGAEDVFPHKSVRGDKSKADADVWGFGPYSRPSSRSNDGGHTYLNIDFRQAGGSPRTELSISFQNDTVVNYSDSLFLADVRYDYLTPGWPRRAAPEASKLDTAVTGSFFDPLVTGLALSSSGNNKDTVLALLSESGRFYLYSVNGAKRESYGDKVAAVRLTDYHGKAVDTDITVTYFDSIPGAFTFPTAIGGKIYVPASSIPTTPFLSKAASRPSSTSSKTAKSSRAPSSRMSKTSQAGDAIYVYGSVDMTDRTILHLPSAPSSYVCGIDNASWAIGLTDGRIIVGTNISVIDTIKLSSDSSVCALAALKDNIGGFAAVQSDGVVSVVKPNRDSVVSTKITKGIPPFTVVTGDLDNDGKESELVISDSRQGVWVYTRELKLAQGWKDDPNDWANAYYVDPQRRSGADRNRYPKNYSAPALVDLNRDGNLDIIVSGINGIYALNRKGALLSGWPAYLDNRYWYQRGSVTTSPIAVSSNRNEPTVLFSSPTGETATFSVAKVITADTRTGVVTFRRDDGKLDSLWDMSAASIDTIMTIGDSLVYPYTLPGGFVDALTGNAARPLERELGSWPIPQSRWPLSTGASVTTSPLVYRASQNTSPALFAVSSDGMVYRWDLSNGMRVDSLYWPQNGFDAARSFAYGGPKPVAKEDKNKEPITLWSYPNPTSKEDAYTTFKYRFSGNAKNVRLDIHTITGYRTDTFKNLSGDFPGWNEFRVNLRKYGQGIYRCRMEAEVGGKKYSKFWKMAVVK